MSSKKRIYHLTPEQKLLILERDLYLCVYCNSPATVVDHIVPYCWSRCNLDWNLAAACETCNQIASGTIFYSFNEKREYIMAKRNSLKWRRRLARRENICNKCKREYDLDNSCTHLLCTECTKNEYDGEMSL